MHPLAQVAFVVLPVAVVLVVAVAVAVALEQVQVQQVQQQVLVPSNRVVFAPIAVC